MLVVAAGLVCIVGPGLQAPASATGTPAQAPAPVEATATVLLTELSGLNLSAATFNASLYVSLTCDTRCPAKDWDILNAVTVSKRVISQEGNTTWWVVQGTFLFQPQLRLFPFDTQELSIDFEHRLLDASELIFVPDPARSEVTPEVSIPGWEIEDFSFTSSATDYESLGADYSRMTFEVPVSRSTLATVTMFYLPLGIFVFLGVATMTLRRFETQVASGGSTLVGVTVFYLATKQGVGSAGYLSVWDLSVLLSFIALGQVLLTGIIGLYRTDRGDFEGDEGIALSRRMRRRSFTILLGIIALGVVAITLVGVTT